MNLNSSTHRPDMNQNPRWAGACLRDFQRRFRPPRYLSLFSLPNYHPARFSSLVLPAAAIERSHDLKTGTRPVEEGISRERPHRPHLLVPALDFIASGLTIPVKRHPVRKALIARDLPQSRSCDFTAASSIHPASRRSDGEKESIALSGQALLLPRNQAFHPDADGLKWR
jgi:hypothetical protein